MDNTRKPLKTAILCISDVYLSRGLQLQHFYEARGDEVRIFTPDFSHRHKMHIDHPIKGVTYLPHRPYQKNLSWQRLAGHAQFARECRKQLEAWKPDRIHSLVPANSLAKEMARYKHQHPEVKLYFDIIDLWPESLPIEWFQKTPAASLWRRERNPYLPAANQVFAECSLFARIIEEQTGIHPEVLYWTIDDHHESLNPSLNPQLDAKRMALCYLGSVNNIIDLDYMEQFLARMAQIVPVDLHLIANGEKKQEMVERLSRSVHVIDHGLVYDPKEKQDIFNQCNFGLNLMKSSVVIGLSMKALDYLQGGLPVINSLQGDLKEWIDDEKCGINIDRSDLEQTVQRVLSLTIEKQLEMRKNAAGFYQNVLSLKAFEAHLAEILDREEGKAGMESIHSHAASPRTVPSKESLEKTQTPDHSSILAKGTSSSADASALQAKTKDAADSGLKSQPTETQSLTRPVLSRVARNQKRQAKTDGKP